MADTVSTAYDLNLDGQYYDGDTRRIKVKNPKEQDEATWRTQINTLGDYIAEKQFLIGDKNAGKFEKFSAANIVWKQTTKFDLSTTSKSSPNLTLSENTITVQNAFENTYTITATHEGNGTLSYNWEYTSQEFQSATKSVSISDNTITVTINGLYIDSSDKDGRTDAILDITIAETENYSTQTAQITIISLAGEQPTPTPDPSPEP